MFSCLRVATACVNMTPHGQVVLIFLQSVVIYVRLVQGRNPQRSASPGSQRVRYHVPLLQLQCNVIAHACKCNGNYAKQTNLCCLCRPPTTMCHTGLSLCRQPGTICDLCGSQK